MKKEKKKIFKNKYQMIIYICLYIVLIYLFIFVSKIDYSKHESSDSIKFSSLYSLVPENNVYAFSNANDVLDVLNGRSGVILFSFPSNKWSNNYAFLLNKAALYTGIDKIYYYDFLKDRDESNGTYETIINKLGSHVKANDEDVKEIYAPTLLVVKNGEIISYLDGLTFTNANVSEYFEENEYIIYDEFINILESYVSE